MPNCLTPLIQAGLLAQPAGITGVEQPRPAAAYYVEDSATGARCHYNQDSEEDRCWIVLAAVQDSWERQTEWGWNPPFPDEGVGGSDGLDIYFSEWASGGAYTETNYIDADPTDGRLGTASYIALDPTIEDDVLDLYIAHEFNHVLQYATDMIEPHYPTWEGAAVRAEEITYPGEGSWLAYGQDFQNTPWVSVLGDSYALWDDHRIWSYYEYGTGFWFEHLAQVYGIEAWELWEALIQDCASEIGCVNEPDVWDAMQTVTGDADGWLMELTIERGRIGGPLASGWTDGFSHAAAIGITADALEADYTPDYAPYDLGTVFVDVTAEGWMELTLDGSSETRWGVARIGDGSWEIYEAPVLFEGPQKLAVVAIGAEDWDADQRLRQRDFTLRLSEGEAPEDTGLDDTGLEDTGGADDTGADDTGADDAGADDTGGPSEDPNPAEPGGCGCASSQPPSGGWGWAGALLAGLLLRRRR